MNAYHTCLSLWVVALFSLLFSGPLLAHGDETHDEPKATSAAFTAGATGLPRTAAASEDFEWVTWLEAPAEGPVRLWISLNHFATNQPLNPTRLELTAGTQPLHLEHSGLGLYFSPLEALPTAPLALTLSLETPTSSDLLVATLPAPVSTPTAPHSHRGLAAAGWGAALLAGLVAFGLWQGLFRKNRALA